ncbi:MAG: thiol peroxidase [Limnochordales bacterium]|nr:thiol peroxidase [Bacillota bacterium]REJ33933.1 MAG: thiol peroxidase [Bacillota bacterium]
MGQVIFGGKPVELAGTPVEVGQEAPDFTVIANDLSEFRFRDTSGVRLIASVPSLDTGVCSAETRRFNEEAAKLGNVQVLVISMDLPFAQRRWCAAEGIDRVKTLSDHRDASFGLNYGVLIKDKRLLARAIFVVDSNNKITYKEIVPVVSDHPNYEAALEAARAAK